MNNTVKNFLNEHNINPEKLLEVGDIKVYSAKDINKIVEMNSIYKPNVIRRVSIDNIKGYDYNYMDLDNKSLLDNMSHFFNLNGSGYSKRSLSMLDYSSNEIMDKLSYSFQREPICLVEADKNQLIIGNNGLHRYHILKVHYLNELSKLDKNDKINQKKLKEKYSFDAIISEVDFTKTYSKYLLNKISNLKNENLEFNSELNSQYKQTGNIIIKQYNTESKVYNDNELSCFLKEYISNFVTNKKISKKIKKGFVEDICNDYQKYDSFKDFIDNNASYIKEIKGFNIEEAGLCN